MLILIDEFMTPISSLIEFTDDYDFELYLSDRGEIGEFIGDMLFNSLNYEFGSIFIVG